MTAEKTVEAFNQRLVGFYPAHLGIVFTSAEPAAVRAEFLVQAHLMAPNGYLHGGAVVSLADTCAGFACFANLPAEASGYTTAELKMNFLGTAKQGTIACVATPVHLGRSTQVWDATVTHVESGRKLAVFRCTQMILYPST
jgi:1,4-dihydroxy-2-naphthoyl-CoA hydrolase